MAGPGGAFDAHAPADGFRLRGAAKLEFVTEARAVAQGEQAYTDALSTYTEQRDMVAREGVKFLADHPFAAALAARTRALAPAPSRASMRGSAQAAAA